MRHWPLASAAPALAFGLAFGLASCAVGPNYHRPTPPRIDHYTSGTDPTVTVEAQGVAQRFSRDTSLAGDWWHLFNSPDIDAIVGEALKNNPGLDAARATLEESSDNLRSGYGVFFPQAEFDASGTRQRYPPVKLGEQAPATLFNLFTLSGSVSYALDVFGGQRRMIEGLKAEVDLEQATVRGTYLTLIANIVNTIVARSAYRAEIESTQQLIEFERQQVGIAKTQFEAGTVPYANVLTLQSQLASTEAVIPQLQQKLSQSEDLLATLVGRTPAEWHAPDVALAALTLPSDLPLELPSALVTRRPDILIAEATAHAASAQIGVATANLLPSITLSGAYSANGLSTQSLFAANGRGWSAGANLSAPVFQGGTLWYRRKAAIDAYRASDALYRQTVLAAFAQVADTLRALEHDAAALRAEDLAVRSAHAALKLVTANYAAGLNTYLDVLAADAQYQQAEINDYAAIAVRYQDTVALYVALGGGWWLDRPAVSAAPASPARGR